MKNTGQLSPPTTPNVFKGDEQMAPKINNMQKIVFSKTFKNPTWQKTVIFSKINPDEIKQLKHLSGKNMLIVGSSTIVQQFTNLNLIDEYHFLVHPIILGPGKPLFKDISKKHYLELLESRTFKNGVVLLRYQPKK